MSRNYFIIGGLCLIVLVSFFALDLAIAEEEGIKLYEGKNYLEINNSIYVSELVFLNPDIESVSYFDGFLNRSVGYVNTFGGVGVNFLIEPGEVYEISVDRNTTLELYGEK